MAGEIAVGHRCTQPGVFVPLPQTPFLDIGRDMEEQFDQHCAVVGLLRFELVDLVERARPFVVVELALRPGMPDAVANRAAGASAWAAASAMVTVRMSAAALRAA